eukprot:5520652-Lingulodinium_polyedra.AAC.1
MEDPACRDHVQCCLPLLKILAGNVSSAARRRAKEARKFNHRCCGCQSVTVRAVWLSGDAESAGEA